MDEIAGRRPAVQRAAFGFGRGNCPAGPAILKGAEGFVYETAKASMERKTGVLRVGRRRLGSVRFDGRAHGGFFRELGRIMGR